MGREVESSEQWKVRAGRGASRGQGLDGKGKAGNVALVKRRNRGGAMREEAGP